MADIYEVRRLNLKRLVADYEGMNALARQLGLSKGAYLSQLITLKPGTKGHRRISEKTARAWEKKLGLPEGSFDKVSHRQSVGVDHPTPAHDPALLSSVISVVTDALKEAKVTLSTDRFAEFVTMQYTDAIAAGNVDSDRIRKLVGFMKR